MDILEYVRAIIRGWWIVLAMLLASIGVAVLYSFSQPPTYEATATYLATPSQIFAETYDYLSSLDTLSSRSAIVITYCNILTSGAIFEQATGALGVDPGSISAKPNLYTVTCVVLPESSILELRVTGSSAQLTADLANMIGEQGVTYVGDLQEVYRLVSLDPAFPATKPILPNHMIDLALGMILGVVGGIGTVVVRHLLMTQFKDLMADTSAETRNLPGTGNLRSNSLAAARADALVSASNGAAAHSTSEVEQSVQEKS